MPLNLLFKCQKPIDCQRNRMNTHITQYCMRTDEYHRAVNACVDFSKNTITILEKQKKIIIDSFFFFFIDNFDRNGIGIHLWIVLNVSCNRR